MGSRPQPVDDPVGVTVLHFVAAEVLDAQDVAVAGTRLAVAGLAGRPAGTRVTLVVRPEAVRLSQAEEGLRGTVVRATFLGNVAEYRIAVAQAGEWLVEVSNPVENGLFAVGAAVSLTPSAAAVHVLA